MRSIWSDNRLDVLGVFGILENFNEHDHSVTEINTLMAEVERDLTDEKKEDLGVDPTVLRATRISGKKTIAGTRATCRSRRFW